MTGAITEEAISAERCGDADAVDVDDRRERGLAALMSGMAVYTLGRSDPLKMNVPGPKQLAEALLWQVRCAKMRLSAVREALNAMGFTFDWQTGDLAVEREAGLNALDDADALIDGLRAPLLTWLGSFGDVRLVELDRETMNAVESLVALIPGYMGRQVETVVRGAVLHLAAEPSAEAIIAMAEQGRREALGREYGLYSGVRDRSGWPWTKESGEPRPDGEADTSSGSLKPEEISGLADSGDSRREDDSADRDKTFAFPGEGQLGVRVQVWDGDESKMRCALDLPVLFSDPGPAAERRVVSRVAQIAAEELRRCAEGIAKSAAGVLDRVENNGSSAEAESASAEPREQSAQAR